MLKQTFLSIAAFALMLATLPVSRTAFATESEPTVIATPFKFCQYFVEGNRIMVGDSTKPDCSSYPDVVGAPLVTDGIYRLESGDEVILKNLNFTYNSLRAPFAVWGGHLTIDGGTYTTGGSCLFYFTYHYDGTDNTDGVTIISGDFAAEGGYARYSQTPICLNFDANQGNEYNANVLQAVLGPNSYYSEYKTSTEIVLTSNIASGVENTAKLRSVVDEIAYINRTAFSVRERTLGQGEVGPTSEEPDSEPEPETPAQPEVTIPKAPNTAVAR